MTVVVLGDLMVDVVARHDTSLAHGSDTPARTALMPGGAGANVAAWLAYAGMPVALVGCVGDDPAAETALDRLGGVDARVRRADDRPTGTCIVLVGPDGERTMLPDAGANAALRPEDLPADLFAAGNVLYLSGYTVLRAPTRATAAAALDMARRAGMRTVVDPASAAPLAIDAGFLEAIGSVDLLLPNAAEAEILGPAAAHHAREIVVTLGAAGASWSDGRSDHAVPAAEATAVDTTGAGDAFAAGFLSAWPGPPREALTRGAELAAEAVAVVGGRPGRPPTQLSA